MADEPTIEQVAADQRATDPRLPPAAAAPAPEPAPTPEPEPAAVAQPLAEAEAETPPPDPAPKPKRTAEEVLKGRVGHLTKTLSAKDAAIAAAERRAEAAEALLAAANRPVPADGEPAPAPTPAPPTINPATGRTYTQAEFDAAVTERAAAADFNRQADAMYDTGSKKFEDWQQSVEMLNATGLMTRDLLDAAMATEAGAEVIHNLGNDVEEAQRIAALPPIRMAAELTRMAAKLTAPAAVRVSGAPAPIPSINGAVKPSVDLERAAAGGNDMSAYAEARAKQGARWAQPRGSRAPS